MPHAEAGFFSMIDIEFAGVIKMYPTRKGRPVVALDKVSFSVPGGGFTTLLGPSGCGKSTCLKLASGLSRPTAGVVRVKGDEVTGPQLGMGMVFQSDVLLEWRTAARNVLLPTEGRGVKIPAANERALELLHSVGLTGFEDRLPHELSGGMRQRVALCRALITDPPILLMDEPFGAVDAITRDQLNLDLQALWNERRSTVLFVTHSITEAVFLSDQVLVMTARPGQIQESVHIDLPRPRSLETRGLPRFTDYVREIRQCLLSSGVITEEVGDVH
jgi:NitT/TauT family transport system ATP-binding protein